MGYPTEIYRVSYQKTGLYHGVMVAITALRTDYRASCRLAMMEREAGQ